jgi:hypothetical protein
MKSLTLILHLLAIVTAGFCLFSLRHELTKRPMGRLGWALPPILAVVTAALLMGVSPGKRLELWALTIVLGLAAGLGAGVILRVDKDFERSLVRVWRTYDGVAAGILLLLLAIVRFITTDLMGRPSQGFGVLAGAAAFLACFFVGRVVTLRYYTARKAIHLDMKRRRWAAIDRGGAAALLVDAAAEPGARARPHQQEEGGDLQSPLEEREQPRQVGRSDAPQRGDPRCRGEGRQHDQDPFAGRAAPPRDAEHQQRHHGRRRDHGGGIGDRVDLVVQHQPVGQRGVDPAHHQRADLHALEQADGIRDGRRLGADEAHDP